MAWQWSVQLERDVQEEELHIVFEVGSAEQTSKENGKAIE